MQSLYARQLIFSVQKFIFALAHLVEGEELDLFKADVRQKGGESPCIFETCVEAGDHRDPRKDVQALFVRPAEIFNDLLIAKTGAFSMDCRVIVLDVVEKEVKLRSQSLKDLRADAAGGLNSCVNAFSLKLGDERLREVRLDHAFTAGDGDAAAGFLVEIDVLEAGLVYFVDSLQLALARQCAAGTFLYAFQAAGAPGVVDEDALFGVITGSGHGNGLFRADLNTPVAVQAVLAPVHDLDPGTLGFRVGTPFAAEGTSLEKDRGPYTRTVVDGKLLNIKNNALGFHGCKLLIECRDSLRRLSLLIKYYHMGNEL